MLFFSLLSSPHHHHIPLLLIHLPRDQACIFQMIEIGCGFYGSPIIRAIPDPVYNFSFKDQLPPAVIDDEKFQINLGRIDEPEYVVLLIIIQREGIRKNEPAMTIEIPSSHLRIHRSNTFINHL